MAGRIYLVGTMDTKGEEISFAAQIIRECGVEPVLVDVGTGGDPTMDVDIDRKTVAAFHPQGGDAVLRKSDRGAAVSAMGEALLEFLNAEYHQNRVDGVFGVGGTGGTALIAPAFQSLPIGLPKMIVSTVASGQTASYIGVSDLILAPSVVDIAGLNRVSRRILANAARAISGMISETKTCADDDGRVAGLTMFGVTTPCVTGVRRALEKQGWECLVFHATGTGGRAMEELASSGLIHALLDLTTTEVADEVVGGIFPAGARRFDLLSRQKIPCVMSVGAMDMVNFGPVSSVPEKFGKRKLHVHNKQITLMRTTPDENRAIARWMAEKLNRATGPLTLLLPEGGLSMLDGPGGPFEDPEADAALFEELEKQISLLPARQIIRLPFHINDPEFADAVIQAFHQIENKSHEIVQK